MVSKLRAKQAKFHILSLFVFTIVLLYLGAFILASPAAIWQGMVNIVTSRDALISDYFVIAGVGGALFNSATVLLLALGLLLVLKLNFTGTTIAAFFIMGGFSFFGKNPLNILPIIFGAYLYARVQGVKMTRYVYVALFSTCLAPLVTEMNQILPFVLPINILCGVLIGIAAGYITVPLAAHTISMHHGYMLFNTGFAAGILALCLVSILRSFGLQFDTVLLWFEGINVPALCLIYGYFAIVFFYGLLLEGFRLAPWVRLLRHPGRSIADFILLDGVGASFMNMGIMGAVCLTYIVVIGGDLSGPVLGAILTVMGFSSFGIHLKNYLPVLLGVILAGLLNILPINAPSFQLVALFVAGLSPIAGQFGVAAGLVAGFLHAGVALYITTVCGGMNLYNNGFAAGFVAIIMIPTLESFIKRYTK